MDNTRLKEQKKCVAIQVPVSLVVELDELKEQVAISKNALLLDLLKKGLEVYKKEYGGK